MVEREIKDYSHLIDIAAGLLASSDKAQQDLGQTYLKGFGPDQVRMALELSEEKKRKRGDSIYQADSINQPVLSKESKADLYRKLAATMEKAGYPKGRDAYLKEAQRLEDEDQS